MWRELLGLAFLMSLNPVLLGLILVVISRPRPVQNLLAFWVGALVVNVPSFVIALFALHMVPSFASFAKNLATADPGSSIKPLQLGTGVLCVVIAVWIATRLRSRQRENQPVATGRAAIRRSWYWTRRHQRSKPGRWAESGVLFLTSARHFSAFFTEARAPGRTVRCGWHWYSESDTCRRHHWFCWWTPSSWVPVPR